MYRWFSNGVYSSKVDKDYVIKGDGLNLNLYIKESKRYVKDIKISDDYYVSGKSFAVALYTETENVGKDLITATSSNSNVLMSHPYSNDVFENGKVRMWFDIKGTGTTTLTFKNSNNSVIVNKTITIVYVNAKYKVLDEKIAAPEITSLTYNPGRVTKPTINYNINDPTKKICIEYKSNDRNFWVDFGEDYATGSLISEDNWYALYPGHTYQFRAYLYDPNNKYTSTAYGPIFTCKYEAPAPTFSVENPGYNYNVVKISGNRSDYDNIYVYRSVYSNKGFKRVGTISSGETEFKDKSLTTGKTYYYKVIGDVKVNYAKSLTSSVKGKKVLPSKVSGVKLTPSVSTKVKVSWGKVSGANGYQIYRATSLNGKYSKVATIKKGSTVSYTNSKLSSNKTYYYKVRAYRTVKKKTYYGSYSDVMTVRTSPGAPKISTSSGGYDGVKINVKSVSGASGYDIYRATSKKGKYAKVATVNSAGVYTDKGLSSNKTYYYKVRAYNSNGAYGSYSSVISRKTSVKPPDKVVGVNFTPSSSTSVKIVWSKASGASGYQIYRATSLNGKYSKVATIKKGSTVSYTNSKLSRNATYYYKIRAYKTVKKKTYYGSYSDVMTVEMSPLSQN